MNGCNSNGEIIRTYLIDDYGDNLPFSCSTGTMWHIPSGTTLGVCPDHQYFIYGDMLVEGELQLSGNSQLVVLNGNINLSGGTITGSGNVYNVFLPLTDTKISGLTYDGSILTIYQTDGSNFSANIAFTGNTSGTCINNIYVSNINSCSPLHIQPINNGDVYISENGGNVGIGTISPQSTLDVNGKISTINFQMTSGATNGYVLTSDVSGNAIWSAPFSGVSVDTYVTGFTYDSSNNLTISQNQGQPDLTVTLPPYITGFTDYYVTGGTYSNGTLTLDRQDSSFTISGFLTGNTIDTYVTGFTYSNNNLFITQNEGQPDLVVTIDTMTGLTINGSFSASTYLGLPIDPDNYVTGGTYSNGTLTLDRQNGSVSISGFLSADTYVTGFTFNNGTYDLTISQNNGLPSLTQNLGILASDVNVTGGTYNPSNGVATFYNNAGGSFQVSGFLTGFTDIYLTSGSYNSNTGDLTLTRTDNVNVVVTGFTDYYVTGGTYSNGILTLNRQNGSVSISGLNFTGNTSGDCITDLFVSNLNSCSPLHIQPLSGSGNVLIGENGGVNVGIGTTSPTSKLQILGSDSSSSNYSLKVQDSLNRNILSTRNDNFVLAGDNAVSSYLWLNGSSGQFGFTNETSYPYLYLNSSYSNKFFISNGGSGGNSFAQINTNNGNWLFSSPNSNVYTASLTDTKVKIVGVDSSSSNYGLRVQDSGSTDNLVVRNDGNVGIGTIFPTEKLEISGKTKTTTLQVTSGATNGYVLTSDASGNAIWSSPSSLTGLSTTDYYVTGGTFSGTTLTLNRQNGLVTITGFTSTSVDTYTTGFTYLNNNLTISQNQGQSPLNVNISVMTGLTINGTLSATTLNTPIANTQVIYSNGGTLTGSTNLTWVNSATTLTINGTLEATSKSFSIPHPTKEGKKLIYGSLEGPENGVYHRGKLYKEDTILLPEYWFKLVDKDSVTIHLTPIGKHQDLFVKEILEDKIIIGIKSGLFTDKTINCFYVVYGERKDINKLEIER